MGASETETRDRGRPVSRPFGFLKTTALGGLIFLLPLIVIGALVGQVVPIVISIAQALDDVLPVHTAAGVSLLVAAAIGVLLLLCFLSGLVARVSFGQRFSAWMERNLLLIFPRYAVVREQMADNVGDADDQKRRLTPVLVTFDDHRRVGLESDRSRGIVAVYLPTAPDAWSGWVAYVSEDRVEPLDLEFSDAVATCERMGRASIDVLASAGARESAGDQSPG